MGKYTGTKEQAGGSFLGADFWKKGVRIEGVVTGTFETSVGMSYSIALNKAVKLDGKDEEHVSIGGLKGLRMALRAAGLPDQELVTGDAIIIECTGKTPTDKGNDQINFKVLVDRKE